jgi:hypothetical protein
MSLETIPGTRLQYWLVAFDQSGRERTDDPGGLMTERVSEAIATKENTDVFLISHGWNGDLPAARLQYAEWIKAMAACAGDIAARKDRRALVVGLHWPSLAWGNEDFGLDSLSFSEGDNPSVPHEEWYRSQFADSSKAQQALDVIFESVRQGELKMSTAVKGAYYTLDESSGLEAEEEGASPGSDREPFDPQGIVDAAQEDLSFGLPTATPLLEPLRVLTFWMMKSRAKTIGETGGRALLAQLQQAANGRDIRFHLMGHSFGSIVVSAILAGDVRKPVRSLFLVQGALSLWSFTSQIPSLPQKAGFFRSVVQGGSAELIVTTRSRLDKALGIFYPKGAAARGDIQFVAIGHTKPALPKYGAVGAYGIQGEGIQIQEESIKAADQSYAFRPGTVYNFECSTVICNGSGFSGAHGDIAKPEIAHALWQAAGR